MDETYKLTDEERTCIIDALYDQSARLNEAGQNKKNDPAIWRLARQEADRFAVLASRLKNVNSFQYQWQEKS